MKYVVIVNGKPEAGKTTFERACVNYLDICDFAYGHIISTIAPIKDIYKQLGWNGKKTDKARKDLSTLKQMWTDTCDGPTKYIIKSVLALDDDSDHIMFVDIREESEIIKLTDMLDTLSVLGIKYTTVFMDRPRHKGLEYGNKSDDDVGKNMSLYQHHICNDGDFEELRSKAEDFIDDIEKELEE
jgi:hypothetical protein